MKTKKTRIVPGEYQVNRDKRTVIYTTIAHGIMFTGIARCKGGDEFDEETGKAIAKMKAILAQRKFDLNLTREFISTIQCEIDELRDLDEPFSPHFMRSLQTACEEEKAQLAHIRDLKKRLADYK
jgi:hypothetical protein